MAEQDLQSIAFPTLNETQISKLSQCLEVKTKVYRDGDVLFGVGDRDFKFHIIKEGEVEIVDYSGDVPKTVTVPLSRPPKKCGARPIASRLSVDLPALVGPTRPTHSPPATLRLMSLSASRAVPG